MPTRAPFVAIVDDEESIRRALVRLLKSAGMLAVTYASGTDLLDAMKAHAAPYCVVLDLNMPGMDGLEVASYLQRSWPMLPVIFITGQHSPEVEAQVCARQSVAYLRKPLEGEVLLTAIRTAKERSGLPGEVPIL